MTDIMVIHRFISDYISSNTYIIEFSNTDKVILIDCGILEAESLIDWCKSNKKTPSHVFLTHSDSDHIAGLNALQNVFDVDIYCTRNCSVGIKSSKINLSKYIPIFNGGFEVSKNIIEVEDGEKISLYDSLFHFIHTPGHTKGCMCIKVNNILFTGDTIIKGLKTRINHRFGGNKDDLLKSLSKLKEICCESCIVYPGHGETSLFYNEVN